MFDKPFRLHFSSIIEDFIKGFWVILVLLITNVAQNVNRLKIDVISSKEIFISLGILVGVIILILGTLYLRWRKTYITLTDETLVIERLLLINKKITTIGLKSISNVDFEQNILEKILGTAKLKLDTNSLSTANQNDVKIILKLDKIKELKKSILINIDKTTKNINNGNDINASRENNENSENSQNSESAENSKKTNIANEFYDDNNDNNDEKSTFDVKYDFERILQHTLLSIPIFSVVFIIGVAIFFIITLQNPEMTQEFFANAFGSIIAIFIFVVPIIYSTIRTLFKLYNFKAKRVNDKIYISYGLFTTRKYTIPIDKINAVKIKQPTLARIFKKYTVEIVNVGMADEENDVPVLLLMSSKEELQSKLETLLLELNINVEEEHQPKEAIIPISINFAIWSLFLIIPTIIFLKEYFTIKLILLLVIAIFIITSIILAYRTRKLGGNEDSIYITKGIFAKTTVIIKIRKIQLLELKNSVLTKKLKIQKLKVNILAATANIEHSSGYFKNEIMQKILEKYK